MSSDTKLNILVAYPYMKKDVINILKDNQEHIRFLLDSGAFTAWKKGSIIQIDDYCRFIESLPFTTWNYFTLDVIGNPKETLKNYETMRKRGFKPIPIFTRGEDISVLEDYYRTSEIVAIGGLVGTRGNKGFVKGIMKYIGNRKCHWLGFTSLEFLKYYKPYMCDTSSWESSAQYGTFNLWMGDGKQIRLHKKDFKNKPPDNILNRIKELKFNPMDFMKLSNWHGGQTPNRSLNATSIVVKSVDIEKILKTKLFAACATNLALDLLINGYKRIYL